MKIFFTGAGGFVGRNFQEIFAGKYQLAVPSHKDLDLLDGEAVKSFLTVGKFDIVVHAANFGGNRAQSGLTGILETGKKMFLNVAENKKLFGRMIFLGSGAEYGKQRDVVNISEAEFGKVKPADEYGQGKYFASEYIATSQNIINLRLFGVFGKYEDYATRFISNAICRSLYGLPVVLRQNTLFDYLYVNDLVKIIDFFISHEPKHKFYNATSGQAVELLHLAELVKAACGGGEVQVLNPGLGRQYTSDNSLVMSEVEGLTLTPIKQAIGDLAQWYKENLSNIDKSQLDFDAKK